MATEYEYLKTVEKVKDPYRGNGQGDETVVFGAFDETGRRGQIRRIVRDGDVVTVECIDGPHQGLKISMPWANVRWGREMKPRPAEPKGEGKAEGKARP